MLKITGVAGRCVEKWMLGGRRQRQRDASATGGCGDCAEVMIREHGGECGEIFACA